MKLFQLLKETLLYSNVFVSICVASLTATSFLIYGVHDIRIVLLSFTSTLAYYNLLRLFKLGEYEKGLSPLSRWVIENRLVTLSLAIVGFLLSVWLVWPYPIDRWKMFIPLFVIAGLYSIPIRLGSIRVQLREVPGLKIFLIALLWTFATIRLPLSLSNAFPQPDLIYFELGRFFFILAITIPFDIRDLAFDSPNLKTIPQIFGSQKARGIALVSMFLFLLFNLIMWYNGSLSQSEFHAALFSSMIAFGLLWFSLRRGEWYYAFWIEGLSLLLFVVLSIIYML